MEGEIYMIYINTVNIKDSVISLKPGTWYYNPEVQISPSNATCPCVKWTTSHEDIVSVNEKYGHIHALKEGTAIVYATATDGSGKRDYITVRVNENGGNETTVSGINITESSITLQENQHYELEAVLTPSTATYADIVWASDNPDIATTVGGFVIAKKAGTTTIRAVAVGNIRVFDTCTVTVIPPKRVQGISFAKDEYTLVVGRSDQIYPTFTPSDAYNKTLYWCSGDENIAVVDNGTITAKSVGTTTITAVTEDGSYIASYTLRVVLDEVTLKYDEGTTLVTFNTSGKQWKCLNEDMIFNDENSTKSYLIERANFNWYVNPNPNEMGLIESAYKTYSNDQLKLLYRIDPFGLSYYVEQYAAENYSDLLERIEYKDKIFKLIFGKDPLYFRRKNLQEWEVTTNGSNPSEFISESESIFGMHPIYDHITKAQLKALALDVIAFGISLYFSNIPVGISILYNSIFNIQKNYYLYSVNLDMVNILDSIIPSEAFSAFEKTDPLWCGSIVSAYGSLYNILTTKISTYPNFTKNIISYCNDYLPYNMNFELLNGETVTLQGIYDIASTL